MMTTSALIVGINYIGKSFELHGCINDATNVANELRRLGVSDIELMTDSTAIAPSKEGIMDHLRRKVGDKTVNHLLFYFSGHGTQVPHVGAHMQDTDDGLNECLFCVDEQVIVDDDLQALLTTASVSNVTCIFDCCHSGTMCDLPFTLVQSHGDAHVYTLQVSTVPLAPCNVRCLSSCMDSQKSLESDGHGLFTTALVTVLRQRETSQCIAVCDVLRAINQATPASQRCVLSSTSLDSLLAAGDDLLHPAT
jgi:uncharacterized caspase-like protein